MTIEIGPDFKMPKRPSKSGDVEVLETAAPIIEEELARPTEINPETKDAPNEPDSPDKEKEDAA